MSGRVHGPKYATIASVSIAAAEIILKLQRHGAEHTETLRAFTRDEAEEIIRKL